MKKAIMCFIGAMMVLSLAACTPTPEKHKTGEVKQTEGTNAVDYKKNPDPTAPDLDVVSVYTVSADGSSLEGTMDSVDELSAESLADLLIQYGVLEEGTTVIDYKMEGQPSSEEVGPGIVKIPNVEIESDAKEYGTLNLSKIPDDGKDEMILHAIARTYLENMNVVYITIQVNGETVAENLSVSDVG